MNTLILASSNHGKLTELQAMLPLFHCVSQDALNIKGADETGLSFVENAIIKARHASRLGGHPALADDSGLVVDALNGEPGIYSARFAGEHAHDKDNIELLINRMAHIPDEAREAYFYCAIALVRHAFDPTPLLAIGRFDGYIARQSRGSEGFGYDPIFYLPSHKKTLAELPAKVKNTISHRAQALKQIRDMFIKSKI
jgi:XTP/dITP diphosphohydrolase